MMELLEWAAEKPGRHFIMKMSNTNIETRWRICVWAKEEGEKMQGVPGEGWGETLEAAVKSALAAWHNQEPWGGRHTGINWYVPLSLGTILEKNG